MLSDIWLEYTVCIFSLVAQMVKSLPTMPETRVRSLGWEDPLEKEMATHSSTLAWRIPWMEEPGRLQSMGSQRVRHDWATSFFLSYTVCKSVTCIANTFKCHFNWLLLKSSGTTLVAQMVKCLSTMWETWVRSLGWEDSWKRKWQPTLVLLPWKSHGFSWRRVVQATVHGVTKSQAQLSDFTCT